MSSKCLVPGLGGCNPCNPCAAASCNPCNPCAAACGACNPCNPCGAGGDVAELNPCQAAVVYECLRAEMAAAYAKSGWNSVKGYQGWLNIANAPYQSGTHGGRYVNNYADSHGDYRYAKYEDAGVMPLGSTLAKDSFVVKASGKVAIGPLFVMEKMASGFSADSGDWRYTLIMPNGKVVGTTNGKNSKAVAFCNDCHSAVAEDQDYMMLLPDEYRQ